MLGALTSGEVQVNTVLVQAAVAKQLRQTSLFKNGNVLPALEAESLRPGCYHTQVLERESSQ